MTSKVVGKNPYLVPNLRDAQSGELNADAIRSVFGFDQVDFAKLSQDNNGLYPVSFDKMVFAQGCDVLTRLAQAIVRTIDPQRKKAEDEVITAMHAFMAEFVDRDGHFRLDLVRQGGAELILEEIYGGVRKDVFAAKRDDDGEIADWLGFDRTELAAIARTNGLALFEAIASARLESGIELDRLKDLYRLSDGAPQQGQFAQHTMTAMCGSGALRELFTISFMLGLKGLRDVETSNFGDFETVYRRPPAS